MIILLIQYFFHDMLDYSCYTIKYNNFFIFIYSIFLFKYKLLRKTLMYYLYKMNILVKKLSTNINIKPIKFIRCVNVKEGLIKTNIIKIKECKQQINTNESNYDWLMRIMKEDKKDDIFLL